MSWVLIILGVLFALANFGDVEVEGNRGTFVITMLWRFVGALFPVACIIGAVVLKI